MTSYYEVFEVQPNVEEVGEVSERDQVAGGNQGGWWSEGWGQDSPGVSAWEQPSGGSWRTDRSWMWWSPGYGGRQYTNWSWDGQGSEVGSIASWRSYDKWFWGRGDSGEPERHGRDQGRGQGGCRGPGDEGRAGEASLHSSPRSPPAAGYDRQGNAPSGEVTSVGNGPGPREPGGSDDVEDKKYKGKASNSYPPIFRAKPGESYRDWRRSVDFWLGGEGHQIPKEYVGPRIMVQLRDRAAQLVKHLNNADVNKADGMAKIFEALVRTRAGEDSEEAVTNAMVELAAELEGEQGCPIGASEPNVAGANGEEWLVQRPGGGYIGKKFNGKAALGAEVAGVYGEEDVEHDETDDPGDESLDGDCPELAEAEREAYAMHYKAKQRMAEVKKMRQYYKKDGNSEERRKALAEKIRTTACHNCGEIGHWSKECPKAVRAHQACVATRATKKKGKVKSMSSLDGIPEQPMGQTDHEWDLLVSLCSSNIDENVAGLSARAYMAGPCGVSRGDEEAHEVMWCVQELQSAVILDLGCLKSVAGTKWMNQLLRRWKAAGRWFRVFPEKETFRFGSGNTLPSRFAMQFLATFCGKPVILAFSVVEGDFETSVKPMSAAGSQAARHCRVCGDPGHRGRDCPYIQSEEEVDGPTQEALDMDAASEASRIRKGAQPGRHDEPMFHPALEIATPKRRGRPHVPYPYPESPWEAVGTPILPGRSPKVALATPNYYNMAEGEVTVGDLTEAEKKLVAKSRAKKGHAAAKRVEQLALTGIRAEYPSLSHTWSEDVALNLVGSVRSPMEEESEVARNVAGEGGGGTVGTPGSYAPTTPCSGSPDTDVRRVNAEDEDGIQDIWRLLTDPSPMTPSQDLQPGRRGHYEENMEEETMTTDVSVRTGDGYEEDWSSEQVTQHRSRSEPEPENSPEKGVRPARGLTQTMTKTVSAALAVMDKVKAVATWRTDYMVLELFAGSATLSRRARYRDGWACYEPVDVIYGAEHDMTDAKNAQRLSGSSTLWTTSSRTWW
eukprot:s805_g18.t1